MISLERSQLHPRLISQIEGKEISIVISLIQQGMIITGECRLCIRCRAMVATDQTSSAQLPGPSLIYVRFIYAAHLANEIKERVPTISLSSHFKIHILRTAQAHVESGNNPILPMYAPKNTLAYAHFDLNDDKDDLLKKFTCALSAENQERACRS